MMRNDFRAVLQEVGEGMTLKHISYSDESHYEGGTENISTVSILGYLATHGIGAEWLTAGEISFGNSIIFMDGTLTPEVKDRVVVDSTEFEITKVTKHTYQGQTVYNECEVVEFE